MSVATYCALMNTALMVLTAFAIWWTRSGWPLLALSILWTNPTRDNREDKPDER